MKWMIAASVALVFSILLAVETFGSNWLGYCCAHNPPCTAQCEDYMWIDGQRSKKTLGTNWYDTCQTSTAWYDDNKQCTDITDWLVDCGRTLIYTGAGCNADNFLVGKDEMRPKCMGDSDDCGIII